MKIIIILDGMEVQVVVVEDQQLILQKAFQGKEVKVLLQQQPLVEIKAVVVAQVGMQIILLKEMVV